MISVWSSWSPGRFATSTSEAAGYWPSCGSTGPRAAWASTTDLVRRKRDQRARRSSRSAGSTAVTWPSWSASPEAICWAAITSPPGVWRMISIARPGGRLVDGSEHALGVVDVDVPHQREARAATSTPGDGSASSPSPRASARSRSGRAGAAAIRYCRCERRLKRGQDEEEPEQAERVHARLALLRPCVRMVLLDRGVDLGRQPQLRLRETCVVQIR